MTTRSAINVRLGRAGRRVLGVALAAVCVASTTGFDANQKVLAPAGPHAGGVSRLWWIFFPVLAVVYVVTLIFCAVAVARGRARQGRDAGANSIPPPEAKPDEARERRVRSAVVVATALTTIILFVLLVSSFLTGRELTMTRSDAGALTIEVTGHQWWWEVRYDDAVSANVFTTANEIHVPVGQPVILRLSSTDVIHSFWVPNLAGKKDLIPGKSSSVWLRADREGVYRGQCAEFCGMQHAHMAFVVVADPPDKFWAWVAAQRQPAVNPQTDSQKRGQAVFLSATCVMCHAIQGTQANASVGPNLTHVASRAWIAAETIPNTRGHLSGWVANAQGVKPGVLMPPNSLSSEDLQSLLDYLQSLK
ncbi:MAG: cytochrome c oxidase subunit II [Acidobacteria bacterium]|nr:cytochrome c oxidase subunit II [Acidobacteriota bacterium]